MTDLPVEHELIDGEWYVSDGYVGKWNAASHEITMVDATRPFRVSPHPSWAMQRLGPVAEYRPAPPEPTGLGAVVKDANGQVYVHMGALWVRPNRKTGRSYSLIKQPVEVLSAGVTE